MKTNRRIIFTHGRQGIFMAEALVGLALIGVIGLSITVAVQSQARVAAAESEKRLALSEAQRTIELLQMGREVPKNSANGVTITIQRQDAVSPSGWRWVDVRADCGKRHVELSALVPAGDRP